jgi:dTDP-4-dehydrorhamnose reductase
MDLRDESAVRKLVHEVQPHCVIHAAALTSVDECERNPDRAWAANVQATANIVRAAARAGAVVVYISTDSVFDGKRGSYHEGDAVAPINIYAESKLRGEEVALGLHEQVLVVRTNFYGWNAFVGETPGAKRSLAEWVLYRLESGRRVPGWSDVVFSPLLVNDLFSILRMLVAERLTGVVHVGGSEACSKYHFARAVAASFDLDVNLIDRASVDEMRLSAPRPKNTSLESDRIRHVVPAGPDLQSGLRRFRELRESGYAEGLRTLRKGV